jgi:hypothetical protein
MAIESSSSPLQGLSPDKLRKEAFAILPKILSNENCSAAIDQVWNCFEDISNGAVHRKSLLFGKILHIRPRVNLMILELDCCSGTCEKSWQKKCSSPSSRLVENCIPPKEDSVLFSYRRRE